MNPILGIFYKTLPEAEKRCIEIRKSGQKKYYILGLTDGGYLVVPRETVKKHFPGKLK